VDFVEMTPKGSVVDESFDAQGTLVDVWEMCLHMEGSLEGVVGPIGAVGTGIAAAESQELGLMHTSDRGGERCGGELSSLDRRMSAVFILVRGLRR
jgi:hypothetical protein